MPAGQIHVKMVEPACRTATILLALARKVILHPIAVSHVRCFNKFNEFVILIRECREGTQHTKKINC